MYLNCHHQVMSHSCRNPRDSGLINHTRQRPWQVHSCKAVDIGLSSKCQGNSSSQGSLAVSNITFLGAQQISCAITDGPREKDILRHIQQVFFSSTQKTDCHPTPLRMTEYMVWVTIRCPKQQLSGCANSLDLSYSTVLGILAKRVWLYILLM